ncbi:MAG: hypothetical protein L0228_10100 [Planctomycetes bacterium]|nr:hypothetical protein [Planctomycetota bacterium]
MTKRKRKQHEPMSGAVDQTAFENAIRDNLSPEGVAALIALLQIADNYRNGSPENERAINQVNWFRETLLDMIGVEEFNDLINEIGL